MLAVFWLSGDAARAQLRIVTYNTAARPISAGDDVDLTTIFGALGATPVNGIAKRVDVIALQSQSLTVENNTVEQFADVLNSLYGVDSYTAAATGSGNDKVAFVYDAATVDIIDSAEFAIGTRPGFWLQFRPAGYSSPDAVVNAYSVHLTPGNDGAQKDLREAEAAALRAHAAALPNHKNVIYMGDFNIGLSSDQVDAFDEYIAPGEARPVDPVALGSWPNSASDVSKYLTNSTRLDMTGGGINDRFDLQFVTDTLMSGEGLSYVGPSVPGMEDLQHSYRAFGNDGSSYNQAITSPTTDRSQPAEVLQALHDFSDHLPVVADYQVPAMLEVALGAFPTTIGVDQPFSLEFTIRNAADVVDSLGADELDYSISWLLGSPFQEVPGEDYFNLQDFALGETNTHHVSLDTSSLGVKSGRLSIQSGSRALEYLVCDQCVLVDDNPNEIHLEIPISYEVVDTASVLYGDYNDDDVVDAADYTVWRDALGAAASLPNEYPSASPGQVDMEDYAVWIQHFGESLAGGADSLAVETSAAVPEPSVAILLLLGGCLLPRRTATLRAWTRAKQPR